MRRVAIFLVLLTITSPAYAADKAEDRAIEVVLGNNGSGGAYLGISFVKNQPEFYKFAKYYNADLSGVLVFGIIPGHAAEKAGIKVGDIITFVGGNKIRNNAELLRILAEKFRPGDAVKIKFFRNSLGFMEEVEKSANAGDATAQYLLGKTKENSNPTEAAVWYRKAAEQGNARAQTDLGYRYHSGWGVERDDSEAVKWYRKAAEKGDARAQTNLGIMYQNGLGVEQDYIEAAVWHRKAAEQGNAEAQTNLGIMYRYGQGIKQDYSEALKWYRKAAEQDNANAQTNLGIMYRYGQGVKQDYSEALKWYRKAVVVGHDRAQTHLGYMYLKARGVKLDYTEAVKWFRKAADQGNANAQYNLGFMYREGLGVKQDPSKAAMWFLMAAVQGYEGSIAAVVWIYINMYLIYIEIAVIFLLGVVLLKRRKTRSA